MLQSLVHELECLGNRETLVLGLAGLGIAIDDIIPQSRFVARATRLFPNIHGVRGNGSRNSSSNVLKRYPRVSNNAPNEARDSDSD